MIQGVARIDSSTKGVILKTINKSLIVGGLLTAVGLSTVAGVGMASAESGASGNTDPMSGLVQKIATRFNLNQDDVQKVFDEDRQTRETEHQQKQAERLQKLVDNGTITSAQKTAIEAKLKELKAERDAHKAEFKDLNAEQRKAAMERKKTELEAWAKEQGIDLSQLQGIFMGGHRGPGGPR